MVSIFKNYLVGIYPRSKKLIEATRDFDRKRITATELAKFQNSDFSCLLDLQHKLGFSHLSDGQLLWQDLFRPIVEAGNGMEVGALTRYFDNNTFYKQPVVTGKISFEPGKIKNYFSQKFLGAKSLLGFSFFGPVTFAELCDNKYYKSKGKLIEDYAKLLNETGKFLQKQGFQFIKFLEPSLAYEGKKANFKARLAEAKKAYRIAARGITAKTAVHTFFGNLANVYPGVLDLPVDVIGVDFVETNLHDLNEYKFTKSIAAGIVDARNSLLEDPEQLARFAIEVSDGLRPRQTYLTSNCDLDFLPYERAGKKLEILAKAREICEDEYL